MVCEYAKLEVVGNVPKAVEMLPGKSFASKVALLAASACRRPQNGHTALRNLSMVLRHGCLVFTELGRRPYQRRIIHYPFNQMTVQYSYDRLGTLRRVLSSNPGSEFFSDRFDFTMRQDSVDVLGRPLNQRIACSGNPGVAWPCGDWLPNNTSNRFNRLGALVIQERIAAGVARDTMRYDQSGNQIQRRNGITGEVTTMIYPALSNRLDTLRIGASNTVYDYDQAGNRIFQAKPASEFTAWQFDGLSRLVGSASVSNLEPGVLKHFNACRWDAAWRLAQPCGNGGQLALMGLNVTRSSLGWFFVHAPGIDEALLLIDRTDNFFVNKRLQAVTDGRGQLIAIADSAGFITEAYAGSGHDQSSWQGAGLTTQAQTFDPRKWQTNDEWGGIQQFRNRAYDPATGTWIQEDPMGVAGGVNLYRFNNGNPVSFGDPLGLMPCTKEELASGKETVTNEGGAVCVERRNRDEPQKDQEEDFLGKLGRCTREQLGLGELAEAVAVAAGQPIPGTKRFVTPGSSRGTSVAGMVADRVFGKARLPIRLPTIVGGPGTGRVLAIAGTKSVARFAGRAVPIVGLAMMAFDAAHIAACTASDD